MALEVSRTAENIVGAGNVILTNKPLWAPRTSAASPSMCRACCSGLGIGTGEDDKPLHNRISKWI